MIRTESLTKRYGEHLAVNGLDLDVRPGEIYGFLGPNGAGKTSTIHMLLNLMRPTSGHVVIFGEPVKPGSFEYRSEIGVVAEEPLDSAAMTGWELVTYFAALYGCKSPENRMEELFNRLELWDARHSLAHDYSHGMRQKLSLIRAMVHEPRMLILDEPVSGLDPYGIRQVRSLISDYQKQGGTVFISSHILSEIEQTAHRVGILHQGRLLAEDTLAGLRQHIARGVKVVVELEEIPETLVPKLNEEQYVLDVVENGRVLELRLEDDPHVRSLLSRRIAEAGGIVLRMESDEMSLEEAFVTITNSNVQELAGSA